MKNLILSLFLLMLTGCYYDSEEALFGKPSSGCNIAVTNFSTEVKPILTSYCLSCHSNAAASSSGGGIKLENYADVKVSVQNGQLMGTIQHTSGFPAMPKGGGTLGACEILVINTWISKGMLNN
ncbi:MAG: hypothetical protein WCP08_16480 [Prolixibacteraceae bacterium]